MMREFMNCMSGSKRVEMMECDQSDQSGSKRSECTMQLGPNQHHVIP